MEIIAVIFIVLALLFLEIGIYQRYGMYHVSYQSHFLEKEKTEGETVQFIEVVENRKILPIPWLKAELTVSKWLDFPGENSVVTGDSRFVTGFFSVQGNAKVSRVWDISCKKRGIYEVEHVVLVTSDLMGIIRLSIPVSNKREVLTVLPKRYTRVGLILPKLFQQYWGDQTVRISNQTDASLSAGLREYMIGDALNRIHWKASLHAGKWLIRQEEPLGQKTMTVILVLKTYSESSGNMVSDWELIEHTIRVCAQCLWEMCQSGWNLRLCVGEESTKKLPYETQYGGGFGMYHQMLNLLAQLKLKDPVSMVKLLRYSSPNNPNESCLLVTPYTDMNVLQWKKTHHAVVLVTGHAHDAGNCADAIIPQPKYENGK